jgi:hypoxanthine phosphoribosyltransferase
VEDIVDTGLTARKVMAWLRARRPASLRLCALLRKPAARSGVPVDYVGFDIPDRFVVGYGLDLDGAYRNLPYVGVVGNQGIKNQESGIKGVARPVSRHR